MTDPFRLRLLMAISSCIEGVTPDNGYFHDLRGKVFRGREFYDDSDPIPLISIHEVTDGENFPMVPDDESGDADNYLRLIIQGFVAKDFENPTDNAHRLMADVKKVIALERKRGGGRACDLFGLGYRVHDLRIGSGIVTGPMAGVSSYAFFVLPLRLKFTEDVECPFA